MFLFLVSIVKQGFFRFGVNPSKLFSVDLENLTAFTFRETVPNYEFSAKRGFLQQIHPHIFPSEVSYFSTTGTPLVIESQKEQNFSQWIIPSHMCRTHNYLHRFPFFYQYKLDSSKFTSSCLFFNDPDTKHFISLSSNSRNHTFSAHFFTSKSLLSETHAKSCTKASNCIVTMTDPFFIKLTLTENKPFNITVSMKSLHLPAERHNCSAEIIMELEEAVSNPIVKWEKVMAPICSDIYENVPSFFLLTLESLCAFMFVLLILKFAGCFTIKNALCSGNEDLRFNELRDNPIATPVINPVDSV